MTQRFLAIALAGLVLGCTDMSSGPALAIPDTGRVPGAAIPGLVEGGPYALRIYDGDLAGTVGRSTWDFGTRTVSGSFTTEDGETGTFSLPISVRGNQLCSGEGAARTCHVIYAYEDGFMEVTEAGVIHATSLPL